MLLGFHGETQQLKGRVCWWGTQELSADVVAGGDLHWLGGSHPGYESHTTYSEWA